MASDEGSMRLRTSKLVPSVQSASFGRAWPLGSMYTWMRAFSTDVAAPAWMSAPEKTIMSPR